MAIIIIITTTTTAARTSTMMRHVSPHGGYDCGGITQTRGPCCTTITLPFSFLVQFKKPWAVWPSVQFKLPTNVSLPPSIVKVIPVLLLCDINTSAKRREKIEIIIRYWYYYSL